MNTCIELLLDSDELVIETPSTSHIGKALRGLLVAHQDLQQVCLTSYPCRPSGECVCETHYYYNSINM